MNKQNSKAIASDFKQLSKAMKNLSTTQKSTRKRRRKPRKSRAPVDQSMSYKKPSNGMIVTATDTGLRRLRTTTRQGLSDQGIAFLKCAFAPPDFQASSLSGIPDDYQGGSLVRKHRFVDTTTFATGFDVYFLLLPSPGVAYYVATIVAGGSVVSGTPFYPVFYSDFPSMFGTVETSADVVTKFRYVSNHFELIPTVNQMTWSGTVQCWKAPIAVELRAGGTSTGDLYTVTGLQSCNSTLSNQYTSPFIVGLYTACYNANGTFPFQTVIENTQSIPAVIGTADFGQLNYSTSGTNGFNGFDNQFESMIIKVGGVNQNETAIIKTWACVEYQVNPSNALYEFISLSPCDQLAISIYRSVITNLPVGVPFEDNESFWLRVLSIVNRISGMGSVLPGPYGMASRGVNLLSGAGMSLMR